MGGFEELLAIRRENRRLEEEAARRPPVECPIDGTPLDVRPDGVRNCPMGNYRWGDGGIPAGRWGQG